MNECPVCRSPLFGGPEECSECFTPISGTTLSSTSSARILTLIFPGLGHLWIGHLITGVFISFLSALSVGLLFDTVSWDLAFTRRLILWGLFWLPWAVGWSWHIRGKRRRYVAAESLATATVILLVVANFSIFINLIILALGWNY